MFLDRWRARRANRFLIDQIHGEIVAAARTPALYQEFGVADTIEGRFEMVVLHAALTVRRLLAFGTAGAEMAQDVVDRVFHGFEDAMREMAIGDAGVAKRLKAMAGDFAGRSRAYAAALDSHDEAALAAALARNVYRASSPPPQVAGLARRVAAAAVALQALRFEDFAGGRFHFPAAEGEAR
jgi:cytochrome b pre-mRNA-processing protein 3